MPVLLCPARHSARACILNLLLFFLDRARLLAGRCRLDIRRPVVLIFSNGPRLLIGIIAISNPAVNKPVG